MTGLMRTTVLIGRRPGIGRCPHAAPPANPYFLFTAPYRGRIAGIGSFESRLRPSGRGSMLGNCRTAVRVMVKVGWLIAAPSPRRDRSARTLTNDRRAARRPAGVGSPYPTWGISSRSASSRSRWTRPSKADPYRLADFHALRDALTEGDPADRAELYSATLAVTARRRFADPGRAVPPWPSSISAASPRRRGRNQKRRSSPGCGTG